MKKSLFAGLEILEAGDSLSSDNGAFIGVDRENIDRLLRIGAKTHRHTGLSGLSNPLVAPGASVVASAGTISSDTAISVGYTLEDDDGGETMISPVTVVSTQPPLSAPQFAPSAASNYASGSLLVNTYFYALTYGDGEGGETQMGPSVNAERAPGFASGRVILTNLTHDMVSLGASEWRLYRAIGGGVFNLLATGSSSEDTFIDDGTHSLDCSTHPPAGELNTTAGVSTLLVTLPSAIGGATSINLYGTVTGDFGGGSLLGSYPAASAGHVAAFQSLELGAHSPPSVNLSIGGAHQIDPESELLSWHWRGPVAASAALPSGTLGDVRLVTGDGTLWGILSASAAGATGWTRLASGASLALTASAASGNPGSVLNVEKLTFAGSGNVQVRVAKPNPGEALITVTGSGGVPLTVFASGSAVPGAETQNVEKLELIGSGGVNIKETTSGKTAKAVVEGQAATLMDKGMGVMVLKTSEKGAARPQFKCVTWFCKEQPTNMANFDIWIEEGP